LFDRHRTQQEKSSDFNSDNEMNPQHQRRQIKRMSLLDIQSILRVESGTPNRPGDRVRRYLLWRRLDRIIRYEKAKQRVAEQTTIISDAEVLAPPGYG
jgi:hypothetical protein